MDNLSPQQLKKLETLANIIDEGEIGIAKEVVELDERVEKVEKEAETAINTANEALKIASETSKQEGATGYTPQKNVDYFDGKDYILTEKDKREIAQNIKVPIVEKIIERTEVIKEQPIIRETIKNTTIENPINGEQIVDKINELNTDDESLKIDASHIKNLPKIDNRGLTIGGTRPNKVLDGGTEVSGSVTEFNFIGATITTEGVAKRKVNIEFSGGSSAYQTPTSGSVNGSNTVFTWATEPNAICVDGVIINRVSSDGSVNWTLVGLTTTLTIAPNFNIFAIA